MKYKNLIFSIFIVLGVIIFPKNVEAKELNITTIDCGVSGDSVLLESKGKYLLMDTCAEDSNHHVIKYLKSKNISNLDIYISHYHIDHFGELSSIINASLEANSFTIGKIYFPDGSSPDYLRYIKDRINAITVSSEEQSQKNAAIANIDLVSTTRDDIETQIDEITNPNKQPELNYLKLNDTISLGDASIKIIGPVKSRETLANELIEKYSYNAGEAFINNRSLVAMVTVGNTKYLTAGDIEYYEEQALISSGKDIQADIMKLSHHALGKAFSTNTYRLSNNTDFMNKVKPKYAFFSRNENYLGEQTHIAKILEDSITNNRILNLYSSTYNGTTTINIKDDIITVTPTNNYRTIKVEYRDVDTNKEIAPARFYNFSYNNRTESDSVKIPYQLYDYKETIDDYTFDNATDANGNEIVTMDLEITSGNVYTLKYKKNSGTDDEDKQTDDKDEKEDGTDKKEDGTNKNEDGKQEVEVPNTLQRNSIMITILGLIIIGSGIFVIYKEKNREMK